MLGKSPNIAAVVVTHNKLALLQQAVSAIRKQSFACTSVIVVDNASSDGTPEWLATQPALTVIKLSTNQGGAGGFCAGMKAAYEKGADWIWLLDDDAFPSPMALQALLEATASQPLAGFFCSLVQWSDGSPCAMNIPSPSWNWTKQLSVEKPKLVEVSACSFVSCLVNANCVTTLGYPVKDFFIWFDDIEYTRRISAKLPGFLVLDSKVEHHTAKNTGVDWGAITAQNLWRYGLGIRNETSLIFHSKEPLLKRFGVLLAKLAEIFSGLSHKGIPKFLRLRLLLKALSGITWDYSKFIEYPGDAPRAAHLDLAQAAVYQGDKLVKTTPLVYGNNLLWQIHPAAPSEGSSSLIFDDISLRNFASFSATLQLPDQRAASVKFIAKVIVDGKLVKKTEAVLLKGGDCAQMQFSLPDGATFAHDVCRLSFSCEMLDPAANNSYASSYWIFPRLSFRPQLAITSQAATA